MSLSLIEQFELMVFRVAHNQIKQNRLKRNVIKKWAKYIKLPTVIYFRFRQDSIYSFFTSSFTSLFCDNAINGIIISIISSCIQGTTIPAIYFAILSLLLLLNYITNVPLILASIHII